MVGFSAENLIFGIFVFITKSTENVVKYWDFGKVIKGYKVSKRHGGIL